LHPQYLIFHKNLTAYHYSSLKCTITTTKREKMKNMLVTKDYELKVSKTFTNVELENLKT
jgi:hypothetical protein